MRLLIAALALIFAAPCIEAQAIRFDTVSYTVNALCVAGKQCPVLALPGTQVSVCTGSAATLTACLAALATTYTDAGAGTPCSTTSQLTPATGGACLSTSDNQGNFGFWVLPGSYSYYLRVPVTAGGGTYGPYPINLGASAGCPLGATCDANYATLALACTAAGTGTLYITRPWNATPTQSLGCALNFLGNGVIQPANGATVTISSSIAAPTSQKIFNISLGGSIAITLPKPSVYVNWFGAVADSVATVGTSQTAAIQSTVATVSAAGGGIVYVSPSSKCYGVGVGIKIPSNVTLAGSGSTSCLQRIPGAIQSTGDLGSSELVYTDNTTGQSNITIKDLTLDGNQANVTGAVEGQNVGIYLQGVSNVTIQNVTVKNTTTDCIEIEGSGAGHLGNSNEVNVIDVTCIAPIRNGISIVAGTNTHLVRGRFTGATGGSLSVGLDGEEDVPGQFITGLTIDGTEFDNNRDGGILIQPAFDVNPLITVTNVSSHNNGVGFVLSQGEGLKAYNQYSGAPSGNLTVTGGTFSTNATAEIVILGWASASITGETASGVRGLLVEPKNTAIMLGPGSLTGSECDLCIDSTTSFVTMAGVTLETPNCLGCVGYVVTQTTVPYGSSTINGLVYSTSPFAAVASNPHCKSSGPSNANPGILCSDDAGNGVQFTLGNNSGPDLGVVQTFTGVDMCLSANSHSATTAICMSSAGNPYIKGVQTFANNAAAIAGSIPVNGLYHITGTDNLGIVH